MRRVLQNLIIAFTVIFLFTGMFLYRKSEYVEASRAIPVTLITTFLPTDELLNHIND